MHAIWEKRCNIPDFLGLTPIHEHPKVFKNPNGLKPTKTEMVLLLNKMSAYSTTLFSLE